jgi:hypothetical protein
MVIVVVGAVSIVAEMGAGGMIPAATLASGMVRMTIRRHMPLVIRNRGLAQSEYPDDCSKQHALYHLKAPS